MDEYPGALAAYATLRTPIEQLRLPCVDHVEPTVALHRQCGVRVLVHCSRAATAAAWLLSPHGGALTPAEARVHLDSCRHVRKKLLAQRSLSMYYSEVHAVGHGVAEASGGDATQRPRRGSERQREKTEGKRDTGESGE